MSQPSRKSANLSLDSDPVSQARDDLKINLSRAAEHGIKLAVKAEQERLWRLENAGAIRLYRLKSEPILALDLQSNIRSDLPSRVMVPLYLVVDMSWSIPAQSSFPDQRGAPRHGDATHGGASCF